MVGLSESSYYYKPKSGRKGAVPSIHTFHKQQGWINEQQVIEEIKAVLEHEFIDCGYHLMTA
jgi:putative transposase